MAFKVEDLVVSIEFRDKGEARLHLTECRDATKQEIPLLEMFVADCGKTQKPKNPLDHPHAIAFKPDPENIEILVGELKDALAIFSGIDALERQKVERDKRVQGEQRGQEKVDKL